MEKFMWIYGIFAMIEIIVKFSIYLIKQIINIVVIMLIYVKRRMQ